MRLAPSVVVPVVALAACNNDIQVADKDDLAPEVVINAPESGASFTDLEVVDFLGTVGDGDGLDDIATTVWTSSIDGALGDLAATAPDDLGVTRLSTLLSAGNHVVTLRATDTSGKVGEDSVSIAVGAGETAPTTTIDQPIDGALALLGSALTLSGSVEDPRTRPTRWWSSGS
jgi:hypothetical protein